MDVSLQAMINLRVLSTGRRLFALTQVMKAAGERSFGELEAHCAIALKHDRNTRALETRWAAPAEKKTSPVQPIDVKADRTLVDIRDVAETHAGPGEEDEDLRKEVRGMLTAIYPEGVLAVIQRPYIEQLSAMDGILETLKVKKFASLVADLGLTRKVKQLTKQVAEYRAALEQPTPETVGWDKVRVARAEGQDLVLQAVVMILARYRTHSADDVAARTALLGPILEQDEAVRLYLKARRAVEDVNPDTGAIDPSAPIGDAPAAPAPSPTPAVSSEKSDK